MKIPQKIRNYFRKPFTLALLSILIALVLTPPIVVYYYYMHEFGHVAGCYIALQIEGREAICGYSNLMDVLIFPGITVKVPQQTGSTAPVNSPLFYFGGPVMGIIMAAALLYVGWERLKLDKRIFLIMAAFVLFELFNIVCGTDNLTNRPIGDCSSAIVQFLPNLVVIGLAAGISYIAYLKLKKIKI